MKQLLILIFHPTYVVKSRNDLSTFLILISMGAGAGVCGLSFQHLYPRLLNTIPWLGFFRRLHPGNWNPRFDAELFIRGAAMGLLLLGTYTMAYFFLSLLTPGRPKTPARCALAALATCVPVLITCIVGFFFYHIQPLLGLAPAYGFLAAACLQVLLLKDLLGVNRSLIVYLVPSVLTIQLYGCFLLLPS